MCDSRTTSRQLGEPPAYFLARVRAGTDAGSSVFAARRTPLRLAPISATLSPAFAGAGLAAVGAFAVAAGSLQAGHQSLGEIDDLGAGFLAGVRRRDDFLARDLGVDSGQDALLFTRRRRGSGSSAFVGNRDGRRIQTARGSAPHPGIARCCFTKLASLALVLDGGSPGGALRFFPERSLKSCD